MEHRLRVNNWGLHRI